MLAAFLLPILQHPELDAVLDDPKLKGALVGAYVTTMDGKELYARNPDMRLMPASNQKLATAAFALHVLGPDFRPQTRIWKQKGRVLVAASGDPMLTYAQLLETRRALNIKRPIPVFVNQSYRPMHPPGWEWDDLPNKYAAPVAAFTVDRGSFELWSINGRLVFKPWHYGAKARHFIRPGKPRVKYDPLKKLAIVTGVLPKGSKRLDTLALGNPDEAAASILGSRLFPLDTPPLTPPTITIQGPAMADLMKEALTESDNQVSEHLLMLASKVTPNDAEPYEKARAALAAFLTDVVGADPNALRVHDGSGLSRHNLVTARAVAKLLTWADKQPWRDLWRRSLVRPGSGTLEKRLAGGAFEGKTGTLDLVVALSGYIKLQDGREVIAALFLNHHAGDSAETRVLADRFMKAVLDLGNRGTLFAEPHDHEGGPPDPRPGPPDAHRVRGPGRDRYPTRNGAHLRAEPAHALLHRAR